MSIEDHANCDYDYIELFNGGLPSSPSIGKFCGSNMPPTILSQSNAMRVEFHTDSSSSERGFRFTYTTVTNGKQDSHIEFSFPT